jgi:hypothetical protein
LGRLYEFFFWRRLGSLFQILGIYNVVELVELFEEKWRAARWCGEFREDCDEITRRFSPTQK